MTIHIVTDSACDVPPDVAAALGITVVPVFINIGEHSYLDGVELSRAEFFANLTAYPTIPTTAAPASGAFAAVYRQLAAEGATHIISMHIAATLSATYNAARLGAEEVGDLVPVTLFDTQQLAMGAGLLVITAAEAAAAGQTVDEIVQAAEARIARTHVIAVLDTLEFLRRSGRVNWAQFGIGTLLKIKPVVDAHLGTVTMAARVRTSQRAVAKVLELLTAAAPLERVAVLYTDTRAVAEALRDQAAHLLPSAAEIILMQITPAIGAHIGPRAAGFAFISAPR